MILIDSNIPMYLVGAEHANKTVSRRLLETAISNGESLVTDAEVLQEILHRYSAINRLDAIQPAFDAILGVVDSVIPIEQPVVEVAKQLLLGGLRLSARDALHLAVMRHHGIDTVLSFDSGFDRQPGVTRRH